MKKKNKESSIIKFVSIGIALALIFWLFDTTVDTFVFGERGFVSNLLPLDEPMEIWMRIVAVFLIVTFVTYSGLLLRSRQRMEIEFQRKEVEFRHCEERFRSNKDELMERETLFRKREDEFREREKSFLERDEAFRKSEANFRESEARFRQLTENIDEVFWVRSISSYNITYVSPSYRKIWGRDYALLYNDPAVWLDCVYAEDLQRVSVAYSKLGNGSLDEVYRIVRPDGAVRWIRDRAFPILNNMGEVYRIAGIASDITEEKEAAEVVRESRELLNALVNNSTTVIYIKDKEGKYILINKIYEELFKIDRDAIVGKTDHDVFPTELADAFRANDRKVLLAGEPVEFEEVAPHDDGLHTYISVKFPLYNTEGAAYAICGISTDITERKTMEQEFVRLSTTDMLTGAYNRKKMEDLMAMELERVKRFGHSLSLILFDLDHFKNVNDTHGHAVGDLVLKGASDIVRAHMRKTNHFIRWGGEEFCVVAVETDLKGASYLAERIRSEMEAHRFETAGQVTASFGIAQLVEGEISEDLLKRADEALYRAKDNGRNRIEES